ncbi:hypothetical protein [Tellurirhabdus bombi]|uniref:hypothetical protein n=1 Tax=Tellurirhabdus bombi TaxID=2907205 RepID=UPI001F41C0BF|nr:hypothetical protein [Tellurirhabdus bombi]
MKKLIYLLLILPLMLTSCKKDNDVDPDLAKKIAGNYTFSSIIMDGKTYDIDETNISGEADLERETATTVTLSLDFSIGKQSNSGSIKSIELKDAGNGEVELAKDGDYIGTAGNGKFSFKMTDSEGNKFTIIGKH